MKNFIYIAGMFTLAFSPTDCSYDTGNISLSDKNTISEQTSSTSRNDLDSFHEPILRPTKP